MSIKSQVAEKYGVAVGDLVAVVFYNTRSYSKVTAFGTQLKHIKKSIETAPTLANQEFHSRDWADLKSVPQEGHVVEGLTFGLDEGKILLVSGEPPSS